MESAVEESDGVGVRRSVRWVAAREVRWVA